MTVVYMEDPATGNCALFDRAPGVVSPTTAGDPNSDINRPLNDPVNWLTNIYYHSSFNYLEVAFLEQTVISHAAIAAAVTSGSAVDDGADINNSQLFTTDPVDRLLLQHDLGYVPRFKVAINGEMMPPGYPTQSGGGTGAGRFVTAYANTTQIRLHEYANRGTSILAGVNRTYDIMVFAAQPAISGNKMYDWNPVTAVLTLGYGRWASDKRYLQIVPGGSPFKFSLGQTLDLDNGAARVVTPSGTVIEDVITGNKLALRNKTTFGNTIDYGGAFAGSGSIEVQAP